MKTRTGLILGYKISMVYAVIIGIWELAGAFIVLGTTMQAYLMKKYPQNYGFNDAGKCIKPEICANMSLDEKVRVQKSTELGQTLFQAAMGVLFSYYYMTVAKRLVALWA